MLRPRALDRQLHRQPGYDSGGRTGLGIHRSEVLARAGAMLVQFRFLIVDGNSPLPRRQIGMSGSAGSPE